MGNVNTDISQPICTISYGMRRRRKSKTPVVLKINAAAMTTAAMRWDFYGTWRVI